MKKSKKEKRKDTCIIALYKKGSEPKKIKIRLPDALLLIAGFLLIFFILGILSVKYTPIEKLVATNEFQMRTALHKNAMLIDSLENILKKQEQQCNRLLVVLGNKNISIPCDTIPNQTPKKNKVLHKINYVRTSADSLLRETVENEEKFNIAYGGASKKTTIFNLFLYPPVNYEMINKIQKNTATDNYGIDISLRKNSHIMATAEGVVVSTEWSIERGYKIIIQHENNLISCYSYNTTLLKKIGDNVKRGEAISIIEKDRENTFLHFELWYEGTPLNPKDFISF